MKYIQEKYARDLYEELIRSLSAPAEIKVDGAGVHWECVAKCGQRSGKVHCFGNRGPEFLTLFKHNEQEIASGRTALQAETVGAVGRWLNGDSLDVMYGNFQFVDWQKRELICIRDSALQNFPELGIVAPSELAYQTSAQYYLWFRTATRSALIYFYGKEKHPRALFHWDQCELFRFTADEGPVLDAVLKHWLGDNAAPSMMRIKFPWLQIGELANYYENGNPVEGEFLESWDKIEQFYGEYLKEPAILKLLAELRRAGYDRTLRAGQSMWTLMLSRSRRHGLRQDQPCIRFHFSKDKMDILTECSGPPNISGGAIELSRQLEELLANLAKHPID